MAEHVYVVLKEHCPDTGFTSFHIMVFGLTVLRVLCLSKPWVRKEGCCLLHRFGSPLVSWVCFFSSFHLGISLVAMTCLMFFLANNLNETCQLDSFEREVLKKILLHYSLCIIFFLHWRQKWRKQKKSTKQYKTS